MPASPPNQTQTVRPVQLSLSLEDAEMSLFGDVTSGQLYLSVAAIMNADSIICHLNVDEARKLFRVIESFLGRCERNERKG